MLQYLGFIGNVAMQIKRNSDTAVVVKEVLSYMQIMKACTVLQSIPILNKNIIRPIGGAINGMFKPSLVELGKKALDPTALQSHPLVGPSQSMVHSLVSDLKQMSKEIIKVGGTEQNQAIAAYFFDSVYPFVEGATLLAEGFLVYFSIITIVNTIYFYRNKSFTGENGKRPVILTSTLMPERFVLYLPIKPFKPSSRFVFTFNRYTLAFALSLVVIHMIGIEFIILQIYAIQSKIAVIDLQLALAYHGIQQNNGTALLNLVAGNKGIMRTVAEARAPVNTLKNAARGLISGAGFLTATLAALWRKQQDIDVFPSTRPGSSESGDSTGYDTDTNSEMAGSSYQGGEDPVPAGQDAV